MCRSQHGTGKGDINFELAEFENADVNCEKAIFGKGSLSFLNSHFRSLSLNGCHIDNYLDLRVKKCPYVDLSDTVVRDIIDFKPFDFDVDITVDRPMIGSREKFDGMLPVLIRLSQKSDVTFLTNSSELSRQPLGVPEHIDFNQGVVFNSELIAAMASAASFRRAQETSRSESRLPQPIIGRAEETLGNAAGRNRSEMRQLAGHAEDKDKSEIVSLDLNMSRSLIAQKIVIKDGQRGGIIRLAGFDRPEFVSGPKPGLYNALNSFSTSLSPVIFQTIPSGLGVKLDGEILDERFDFILTEMIKNAIVHGHKMHLELPLLIEWDIDTRQKVLRLRVSNQHETDESRLQAISSEDLRFKWLMGGEKKAERFINDLTHGRAVMRHTGSDGRTTAEIEIPLEIRPKIKSDFILGEAARSEVRTDQTVPAQNPERVKGRPGTFSEKGWIELLRDAGSQFTAQGKRWFFLQGIRKFVRSAQPHEALRVQLAQPIEKNWEIQEILYSTPREQEIAIGRKGDVYEFVMCGEKGASPASISPDFEFIGHVHPPYQTIDPRYFLPSSDDLDIPELRNRRLFVISPLGVTWYRYQQTLDVFKPEWDEYYSMVIGKSIPQINAELLGHEVLGDCGIELEIDLRPGRMGPWDGRRSEVRDTSSSREELRNSKSRESLRRKMPEGLRLISEIIIRPEDFERRIRENDFPDLKGLRLGATNADGIFSFYPIANYRFPWPALGFQDKGWEGVITESSVQNGYFQFTIKLSKENEEPIFRTFQIGPYTRQLPGHEKETGKSKTVLDIDDRLRSSNNRKISNGVFAKKTFPISKVFAWARQIRKECLSFLRFRIFSFIGRRLVFMKRVGKAFLPKAVFKTGIFNLWFDFQKGTSFFTEFSR